MKTGIFFKALIEISVSLISKFFFLAINKKLLNEAGFSRPGQLSRGARYFYQVAAKLIDRINKMEVKDAKTQTILEKLCAEIDSGEVYKDKLNRDSFYFINSQMSLQHKTPRSRRYTLENKIFSLSLLKASQKGYRHLQKTFSLPSRRTLVEMLSKIPFNCGVNEKVFYNLEQSTKNMSDGEKMSILMFDEMAIESSLTYESREDKISGFEDFGDGRSSLKFADHALVFMLKGILKPWKQPVAYYFSENGIKSTQLAVILKTLIRKLRATGFDIVATVSDQMSTNIAANSYLKRETAEFCIKNNIPNTFFGYLIDGKEVIYLYDVPHLLKGIRNNLVNNNLLFKWKEDRYETASWQHITDLYEFEQRSSNEDFKLCPKLTEEHVYPSKMKKMKVKMAAQIFSQKTSAVMRYLSKGSRFSSFYFRQNTCIFNF